MTQPERDAASALQGCSFLPGSFDKRWVKQLSNWSDRDMTVKGREMLVTLLKRYKRQIPNWIALTTDLQREAARRKETEQYICDRLADKMHKEITTIEMDTVKKACETVANHFKERP